MNAASPLIAEHEFSRPGRHYAYVKLSIATAPAFAFDSQAVWPEALTPGEIAGLIGAVELGVREELAEWKQANARIVLLEVRHDAALSTQMAFKIAAKMAIRSFLETTGRGG